MAQRCLTCLCYNCPEKFSREHLKLCTMKGIYLLQVGDAPENATSDEDITVSMCTLIGVHTFTMLQLITVIGETSFDALVDSGSTHSFIDVAAADRLGLSLEPRPSLTVGVANGEHVPSTGICKAVDVTIGHESFTIDLYVLNIGAYSLILGYD